MKSIDVKVTRANRARSFMRASLEEASAGAESLAEHGFLPEAPLVLHRDLLDRPLRRWICGMKQRDQLGALALHEAAPSPPLPVRLDDGQAIGEAGRDDRTEERFPIRVGHFTAGGAVPAEVKHVPHK